MLEGENSVKASEEPHKDISPEAAARMQTALNCWSNLELKQCVCLGTQVALKATAGQKDFV